MKKYPPISRSTALGAITVSLLSTSIILALAFAACGTSPEEKRAEKRAELACKKDLQCWGEKNQVDALVDCRPEIERQSEYSARWTADGLGTFKRWNWEGSEHHTIAYIGDAVEFQNVFGAYANYWYVCEYNTKTKKVEGVRVNRGRI